PPDGRHTLSGSRGSKFLFCDLAKFGPSTSVASHGADPGGPSENRGDQPRGSSEVEAPPLRPAAVLSVNGTVGQLTLSPNRKWLFFLNRTENTLVQVEAATLRQTRTLKLADGAEAFALTPDGKTLYALAPATG